MIIVALTDDFTTTDNDGSMPVAQRRLSGLLEAEVEVIVSLHFDGRCRYDWTFDEMVLEAGIAIEYCGCLIFFVMNLITELYLAASKTCSGCTRKHECES